MNQLNDLIKKQNSVRDLINERKKTGIFVGIDRLIKLYWMIDADIKKCGNQYVYIDCKH